MYLYTHIQTVYRMFVVTNSCAKNALELTAGREFSNIKPSGSNCPRIGRRYPPHQSHGGKHLVSIHTENDALGNDTREAKCVVQTKQALLQ